MKRKPSWNAMETVYFPAELFIIIFFKEEERCGWGWEGSMLKTHWIVDLGTTRILGFVTFSNDCFGLHF